MAETKHRVVVAKPGLDGHDRGAKVVARALRDAGFEVIYTGLHQTPEQIAETAIQEDADAVGLSCHSGAHMTLFPRVVDAAARARAPARSWSSAAGIIPADDIPTLEAAGIEKIFTPGRQHRRHRRVAAIRAWTDRTVTRPGGPWISTNTRARTCSARVGIPTPRGIVCGTAEAGGRRHRASSAAAPS